MILVDACAWLAALTTLYWHFGRRALQDLLKDKRAGCGEEFVSALRRQLT